MKKVAILTLHRVRNYGPVLQAYALQETIKRLGARCEILDVLRPGHVGFKYCGSFEQLEPYRTLLAKKERQASLRNKIREGVGTASEHLLVAQARDRFQEFNHTHISLSSKTYSNATDLYDGGLDYDAYVAGSDQVWNPMFRWSPKPFFLTFASPGVPRIAYAPSFGISSIAAEIRPLYADWLAKMSHLSARETHGAEMIKDLTGRTAQTVLDPTLLLSKNDWKALAIPPRCSFPYIFCYSVGDSQRLMSFSYHVQKLTGYPIYKIGNPRHAIRDICDQRVRAVLNAGPREFLGYIMNAAVVVTNSFHGTVLSINLQRPFFTVPVPESSTYSRNSRLYSILKILGATDRLYEPESVVPSAEEFNIEYPDISSTLSKEREQSLCYLKNALPGVKSDNCCHESLIYS